MLVTDQTDEFHHALVVEFIEDVVQQQNGLVANLLVIELKLCQANRDHKRLLLSLRAETLQWMAVQGKFQVVFVDTYVGIARITVLHQTFLK